MKLGYIKKFTIKLPKAVKKIKETYTDEELELLLKKPDIKKCLFTEYRNWVLINYLLATGNRLSTLANIKIGDLDLVNDMIKLSKTKNGKQQIIPLSTTLSKVLKDYLLYRDGTPEDYLFCNQYGDRLTKDGISTAIDRYNKSRGVVRASVHAFRHTFAKKWILNGGDIFKLQRMLGHSSLEMVRNYVNIYSNELKENFDTFNPLESVYKSSGLAEKHRLKLNK